MSFNIQAPEHITFCYSSEKEKEEVVELLKQNIVHTYWLDKLKLNLVNEKLYNIRRDWEKRYLAADKTLKVGVLDYFGNLRDLNNIHWNIRDSTNKNFNSVIHQAFTAV